MSADQSFIFKYSLPDPATGEWVALSFEEVERLLQKNLTEARPNLQDALWELARLYSHAKQHEKALEYLRRVMDLLPDPEHKASCVLGMGQTMEQVGDYEAAVRYYREALILEPVNTGTWYLIHNNLGFSLNTLGKFEDGERYCRAALQIDPTRPNAFKNLGLSLQGQQNFVEAARCFIQATQADASDPRSLKLLEELLVQHPGLDLAEELECCRQAVAVARDARKALEPVVHRGWRKQWILARGKIRSWFKSRR